MYQHVLPIGNSKLHYLLNRFSHEAAKRIAAFIAEELAHTPEMYRDPDAFELRAYHNDTGGFDNETLVVCVDRRETADTNREAPLYGSRELATLQLHVVTFTHDNRNFRMVVAIDESIADIIASLDASRSAHFQAKEEWKRKLESQLDRRGRPKYSHGPPK